MIDLSLLFMSCEISAAWTARTNWEGFCHCLKPSVVYSGIRLATLPWLMGWSTVAWKILHDKTPMFHFLDRTEISWLISYIVYMHIHKSILHDNIILCYTISYHCIILYVYRLFYIGWKFMNIPFKILSLEARPAAPFWSSQSRPPPGPSLSRAMAWLTSWLE